MVQDLSSRIGLGVSIDDNNTLKFSDDVEFENLSSRSFADLAVVAKSEDLVLGSEPAYFMYRGVHRSGDQELLALNNQRFDLTVIPSGNLGVEFIKTSGHYHPVKPNTNIEYSELYYVVSGQATYLMQKHNSQTGAITDVIVARVKAGESILMPPFYGHVTINETDDTLVMANWVEANFASVYGDYELKRGAAYYLLADGSFERNERYEDLPELRAAVTSPKALESLKNVPIYKYAETIDKIELVAKPEEYMNDYALDKLFKFI